MMEATEGAAARLEALFASQAARTPEAPAILYRGAVTTYAALAARAGAMAERLAECGVGPGVLVAVRTGRTPEVIALLLGVLKAGGAWLPLDAREPEARLAFMLADSGAGVLVVDADAASPDGFAGTVLELGAGGLAVRTRGPAPAAVGPAELAYVIYTSGSSGAPKGVMLGHGAVRLVDWARGFYGPEDLARVAATTSLCFDPSIFEMFVPLCTGGAMVLKANALEPFAEDEAPTMLDTVPSVLAELLRGGAIPASVRVLNVGGEPLSRALAEAVHEFRPGIRLYNHYGPTEATTVATVAAVARALAVEPSIGRPVAGAEIVLLDADGEAVGEGGTGEVHIGGPGLALGYLNRPELTAERFVCRDGRRLYRTGDRGVWGEGELCFAGRADRQVKVRGFRVELGEVEAALLRVPGVAGAAATVNGEGGHARLFAHVESRAPLTETGVRRELERWLPPSMMPARIVIGAALPRLASGKLDHGALARAVAERPANDEEGQATGAEGPIIHAFREVLGRTHIGPEDSFFDLGGDSLASVQAALRIEELMGFELPAALLHQAPTPRALARALQHGRGRAERHIAVLQPGGGEGPGLFCMADLFGAAFTYLTFARRLGADQRVYGVVPGPLEEAFSRDRDLGRLTRGFSTAIREAQPDGPYRIAGYSAGGLLAFQVAQKLEAEGEDVRLILLDAFLHARRPSTQALARWTALQMRRIAAHRPTGRPRRGPATSLAEFVAQAAPGNLPDWLPKSQRRFALALMHAQSKHRSGRFSGPTLIVEAAKRNAMDAMFNHDGCLGWSGVLRGEVTRASVKCGHPELMRNPAVAETARVARAFIERVDRRVFAEAELAGLAGRRPLAPVLAPAPEPHFAPAPALSAPAAA